MSKVSKKQQKLDAFNKEYRKILRIKFEDDIDQDVEDFKDLMPHFKEYVDPAEYKAVFANLDADSSRADDFLRILKEAKIELEQSCAPVDSVDKMDEDDEEESVHQSDIDFVAGEELEYTSEKAKQKAERRLKKGADAEELYRQQQNQAEAEEEKKLERLTVKPAAARVLPSASFAQSASKRTSLMSTKDITEILSSDDDEDMHGTDTEQEGEGEEEEVKQNPKKRSKPSGAAKAEARIYQFGEKFIYKNIEYTVKDGAIPGWKIPLVKVDGKLQPNWDKIQYEHLTTAFGRNPNTKDVEDYHNFIQAEGMIPVFVTAEKAKKIDNTYKDTPQQQHPLMQKAKATNNIRYNKETGTERTLMCMANFRQLTKSKADKKSVTANRLGKVMISPQDREQASRCLNLLQTEFKDSVQQFEKGFHPFAPDFKTSEYLDHLEEALKLLVEIKKTNNLFQDFMDYFVNNDPGFSQKFIVFASIVFPTWRKTNESYLSNL